MKVLVMTALILINLTGCVGYTYSKDTDELTSKNLSPTDLQYQTKPKRNSDKTNPDGSESYTLQDGRTWCGLTIWAIIPIPIWLPGCRDYIQVTYKGGSPIRIEQQTPLLSGRICGPFMPWVNFNKFSETGICPAIK